MKKRKTSSNSDIGAVFSRLGSEQTKAAIAAFVEYMYPKLLKRTKELHRVLLTGKAGGPLESHVQYIFTAAFFDRCHTMVEILTQESVVLGDEFVTAMQDVVKLTQVIPITAVNKDLRLAIADVFTKAGMSFSDTSESINAMFPRSVNAGAPRDVSTSVWALELKLLGCTYSTIVQTLCCCNKKKHDKHCDDAMRKRVKRIEPLYNHCCAIVKGSKGLVIK